MDEKIAAAIRERVGEGTLKCAVAFRIAEELGVEPLAVGQTANELQVKLSHCQLGLFGYGEPKSIVEPADPVAPELEQAIRDRLVDGRLPCAAAWEIAARLGIPKLQVSNGAEGLGVRIRTCQLGAFP
ncbi:MAG TPA: hypothetical protein ENK17_02620 [Anaerolineae bacterium]|nr:hypothetical protein [Anaerolineae bacterium]